MMGPAAGPNAFYGAPLRCARACGGEERISFALFGTTEVVQFHDMRYRAFSGHPLHSRAEESKGWNDKPEPRGQRWPGEQPT